MARQPEWLINDLVLGMGDMLRRTLSETIALNTELASALPDAMADHGPIAGAPLNLVLNARDAKPGDYVTLDVIDTGHGMTAKTIEQAFEPYFTTKNIGEGTGLGLSLSMVYGSARQLDGFVEIKPAEKTGQAPETVARWSWWSVC